MYMIDSNRRWAYYYDFNLVSVPADAPAFQMDTVLKNVEILWKNDEAVHKYSNGDITVRIADMNFVNGYTGVLIHLSDIKASDPAFSNIKTGDVRVEEKKDNEGIAVACHVLIKRESIPGKNNRYLAMIEEVKGLPRSMIETFLTAMLRSSCKTHYKSSTGASKEKECRPVLKLHGHPSQTLTQSMEKGALQGITLLKSSTGKYFDDNKELIEAETQLKLKVEGTPRGQHALDLIKTAFNIGKKDYDHIRVVYSEVISKEKKKDSKGNVKTVEKKKQRTVNFETKKAQFAEALFTKSESIRLDTEIGQCEEVSHKELLNKMKKLLVAAVK